MGPRAVIGPRVLMVNKFLYPRGGAEIAMLRLATELERAGARCRFFGMRDERNPPSPDADAFPPAVDFERPSGVSGRLYAGARMFYSTSAHRGIAHMLARDPVDVAHLHNIYHQLSPSILAPLRSAGVPVVLTVHDYKLVCPVYTLLSHGSVCTRCVGGHYRHAVLRRCNRDSLAASAIVAAEARLHRSLGLYLKGIDAYLAPSRYAERVLIAGGYPAERIHLVPNFAPAAAGRPTNPGESILYAGRLSPEKGIDLLLEAAAGTNLQIRLAGDGPERERLEKLAADRKVSATFLGRLGSVELAREFERCRALVLPAVWPENAPLVVLEAMQHGRAVVASAIGGLPELVVDGATGLLVPSRDIRALRTALLHLDADPAWARSLGRAGLARARADYSAERHVNGVLAVYRLLQGSGGAITAA